MDMQRILKRLEDARDVADFYEKKFGVNGLRDRACRVVNNGLEKFCPRGLDYETNFMFEVEDGDIRVSTVFTFKTNSKASTLADVIAEMNQYVDVDIYTSDFPLVRVVCTVSRARIGTEIKAEF